MSLRGAHPAGEGEKLLESFRSPAMNAVQGAHSIVLIHTSFRIAYVGSVLYLGLDFLGPDLWPVRHREQSTYLHPAQEIYIRRSDRAWNTIPPSPPKKQDCSGSNHRQ